jgi:hypothetical protein
LAFFEIELGVGLHLAAEMALSLQPLVEAMEILMIFQ